MSFRTLRSARSGPSDGSGRLRTTSSRAPLPLIAAVAVAAGLSAACGPTSEPVGSATAAGSRASAPALPGGGPSPEASASASASASVSVSATASVLPSASASAPSPSASARAGGAGGKGPTSTASAPAPAPAKVPGPGYDSAADAKALIQAAVRAAKADGRMVLLDFGANWCGNCKAADKVFAQPATSALLADDYHLVKVDIGGDSSANSALLRTYSPSGGTYTMPVLVVVSPSGATRVDTHASGNPALTADGINAFLRKWAP